MRRNPSFGGAINLVTRGLKDGAYIVGGEMAANVIAGYIPALLKSQNAEGAQVETQTGAALRKVIAAAIVGFGAQSIFRGGDAARLMVAGALAAPIKSFIKPMLPSTGVLAGALAAYPRPFGALSAYPMPSLALPSRAPLSGVPSVPARRGVGCAQDESGGYQYGMGY